MNKFTPLLSLILLSFYSFAQPPYSGTTFVEADIITSSDPSVLESVTYKGQDNRVIYDRRVNDWTTVNAFLFEVSWSDGLVSEAIVNPEFETLELATIEAEKYGSNIGQLPYCLRLDVNEIWINKGIELFGGGNNSILIHTGQTELYENDGILEETLVHEASHTSLDATHATHTAWREAQTLDGGFISDYAEEFSEREDIAESFLMWMAVRYRADKISTENYNLITEAIPNRLSYFDDMNCKLSPFETDNDITLNLSIENENRINVFPNPTSNYIFLETKGLSGAQFTIYNAHGISVIRGSFQENKKIDLSGFQNGLYFLLLQTNNEILNRKVIKF